MDEKEITNLIKDLKNCGEKYEDIYDVLLNHMPDEKKEFYTKDLPTVWEMASKYDADIIKYPTAKEEYKRENIPKRRYGEKQTLYIRSLTIRGQLRFYIGIAKHGSLDRLESDRYYSANKDFHEDIRQVMIEAIQNTPTLTEEEKTYVSDKTNEYFSSTRNKSGGYPPLEKT